jgi:rhamnose utilization protein RhaD (predicted bifunctional aldolase and dehydrogenase)
VFVSYVDPGLPLARAIVARTRAYIARQGKSPRLLLLQNHGVIALGKTPEAVLVSLLMLSKAAAIFTGAAVLGGPTFLGPAAVRRIAERPDEAYRRRQLDRTGNSR